MVVTSPSFMTLNLSTAGDALKVLPRDGTPEWDLTLPNELHVCVEFFAANLVDPGLACFGATT